MLNIITKKNILSNLSNIPPWPLSKLEKSFKLFFLLTKEKNISPKNKDKDNKIAINKLISYWNNNKKVKENDNKVPDHVLLGLTDGIINGPFSDLPMIYAIVSLKNATNITKYKYSLSIRNIVKKLSTKINEDSKKNFLK